MWPNYADEVGKFLAEHFHGEPIGSPVPDQGLIFQDLDGEESDDSGLESIL